MSDYACGWCAKALYVGDYAVNLGAFRLGQGRLRGVPCLHEDSFADGSHELFHHHDCFVGQASRGLFGVGMTTGGTCAWCNEVYEFGQHVVMVSLHSVQPYGLETHPMPNGEPEVGYHLGCLEPHVDPTLLGGSVAG